MRSTGGLPPVQAADTRPGNILQKAGIHLFPGDRILVDGQIYKPDQPLIAADNRVIQIIPAARITIRQNEKQIIFSSSASTLGQALWEAGYRLASTDHVDPPMDTLLVGDLQVTIQTARVITVEDGKKLIQIHTSAETVEAALAETGFALTAFDSTEPAANQQLPAGKPIRILRNSEEIILNNKPLAFENEQVYKEDMNQGESEVVQSGENGLEISRERVLFTNGEETGRRSEGTLLVREAVKQITNVGSKLQSDRLISEQIHWITIERNRYMPHLIHPAVRVMITAVPVQPAETRWQKVLSQLPRPGIRFSAVLSIHPGIWCWNDCRHRGWFAWQILGRSRLRRR